jgi:hypothetical protein
LPGLTWQSITDQKATFVDLMDARIKSGHDERRKIQERHHDNQV